MRTTLAKTFADYRTRDEHPLWTLSGALVFYQAVVEPAHASGWLLSLYGSVVASPDGAGQDLDLIACPWRSDADETGLIVALITAAGPIEIADRYHGILGTVGIGGMLQDGRLLDIQIRRPTDALKEREAGFC